MKLQSLLNSQCHITLECQNKCQNVDSFLSSPRKYSEVENIVIGVIYLLDFSGHVTKVHMTQKCDLQSLPCVIVLIMTIWYKLIVVSRITS